MKINIGPYPDNDEETRVIDIQIDKYDLWNMDHTLALIILPMLIEFRKGEIGCPADLSLDEWLGIIDQMIDSFAMIVFDDDDSMDDEKVNKGVLLFGKHFRHLWN